ncbi:hypothetical protein ACFWBD_14350, partial [Streptomyces sp. NPDC060002]
SVGTQGSQGNVGPQGTQGFQGGAGAQGSQGGPGAQGTQGNQGFQGFQGTSSGAQSSVVTATSSTGNAVVLCPAGKFAVGGGYLTNGASNLEMIISRPTGGSPATGWQATAADARTITVYAVCAP